MNNTEIQGGLLVVQAAGHSLPGGNQQIHERDAWA